MKISRTSFSRFFMTGCIAVVLMAHCVYLFAVMARVPLNSDHANQVLQGADILRGNLLLRDWNLTGVSFYFSELPYYTLGTALFGVSPRAYVFAAALMTAILSVTAYCLSFREKLRAGIPGLLLFLALCGMPSLLWMGYLRGHCAIFIYFFLSVHCLGKLFERGTKAWRFPYFGLMAFGCMSDMTLCIIGAVPIVLFCLWELLRNGSVHNRRDVRAVLLGTPVSVVIGMGMDALLMRWGHINKNAFLDTRKFLDIFHVKEKIILLIKGIYVNGRGALIQSGTLDWVRTVLTVVILLSALICPVTVLRDRLRHGDGSRDVPAVILALSLCVMSGVCFFTDIYASEDSARYIAFYPFAGAALLCRKAEARGLFRQIPWKRGMCPLCLVIMGLFALPLPLSHPFDPFAPIETPQSRLAGFLRENGLTDGYGAFWDASHTTVAAGGDVRVRAVRVRAVEVGNPLSLSAQNWFCKSEWYRVPANFIVFDGNGYLDVREDYVEKLLGAPDRILDNGEYRVFVYQRDIQDEIVLEF